MHSTCGSVFAGQIPGGSDTFKAAASASADLQLVVHSCQSCKGEANLKKSSTFRHPTSWLPARHRGYISRPTPACPVSPGILVLRRQFWADYVPNTTVPSLPPTFCLCISPTFPALNPIPVSVSVLLNNSVTLSLTLNSCRYFERSLLTPSVFPISAKVYQSGSLLIYL